MVLTHYYAQIDAARKVFSVTNPSEAVEADDMIPIDSLDSSLLGKVHNAETGEFEEAPPDPNYVPPAVSSRQGQLALLDAGYLEDAEGMIAAIEDGTARKRAQIEWGATMWERQNPFLQQMWASLGGTEEQLDELFRHAATL